MDISLESKKRPVSLQVRMGLLVFGISAILFAISPSAVIGKLRDNFGVNVQVLIYTVVAVVISTAVHFLVPEDFAERHLGKSRLLHLFAATVLGIMTPGPVYAMYPIVFTLKKKGVQNHFLVSYITGQTMVGPARIALEVGLLGWEFFLLRVTLTLFMGTLAGFLFYLISGGSIGEAGGCEADLKR